jgi:hypothetical protein
VPFLYAALLVYLAAIGTLGIVLVLLITVQQITDPGSTEPIPAAVG